MPTPPEPQPISLEDAQRIWNLQKQNAPLSSSDVRLLEQAWRWQAWVSHGILLPNGKIESVPSSQRSKGSPRAAAAV